MNPQFHVLTVLFILLNFSATAFAETSSREGLWLQKDEAEELRATGKVESLCEEIKKDRFLVILNARAIEPDGSVYIYTPQLGKVEQLKLGTLGADGTLAASPFMADQMADATINVTATDATLTFNFKRNDFAVEMDYLRSNDDEIAKYYAAQEACKKPN